MIRTNLSTRPFYNARAVHVLLGLFAVVESIDPTRGAALTDRIQPTPELMATLSPLVGMLLRTRREAVAV